MASPNFDALNVKLSKRLGDPVSSATSDGSRFSSALRDQYLNEGIRRLMRKYVRQVEPDIEEVQMLDPVFFSGGYLSDYAGALAANVVALSTINGTGVFKIISVQNTDGTNAGMVKPLPHTEKPDVLAGDNKYLTSAAIGHNLYLIEGTNLRVIGAGATNTISVQYLKPHTDLSSGGSTDILVPSTYWDQVLDMAYKVGQEEYGTDTSMQVAILKESAIDKQING